MNTNHTNDEAIAVAQQVEDVLAQAVANGREAAQRYAAPELLARIELDGPKATDRSRSTKLGMLLDPAINRIKFAKDGDGTVPADLTYANLALFEGSQAAADAKFIRNRIEKGFKYPEDERDFARALKDCAKWLDRTREALDNYRAAIAR